VLFAAIGLIVLAVLLLFLVPWVGLVAGAVGVVLLVAYAAGIGRRAARERP
jgi:hypothetical protein